MKAKFVNFFISTLILFTGIGARKISAVNYEIQNKFSLIRAEYKQRLEAASHSSRPISNSKAASIKFFAEIKKLRLKNPNVLSEVLKAFYFEQLPEAVKNYIKNNKIFLNLSFERSPWRVMCNVSSERDIDSIIYSFEL